MSQRWKLLTAMSAVSLIFALTLAIVVTAGTSHNVQAQVYHHIEVAANDCEVPWLPVREIKRDVDGKVTEFTRCVRRFVSLNPDECPNDHTFAGQVAMYTYNPNSRNCVHSYLINPLAPIIPAGVEPVTDFHGTEDAYVSEPPPPSSSCPCWQRGEKHWQYEVVAVGGSWSIVPSWGE